MVGQSVTKSAEVGNRNRWYSSNVVDIEPAAPPRTVRALHNEHIYMSNLLDSVEEQIAQIQAGREADFNLLLDIVDYMKSFPDRFHHLVLGLSLSPPVAVDPDVSSGIGLRHCDSPLLNVAIP